MSRHTFQLIYAMWSTAYAGFWIGMLIWAIRIRKDFLRDFPEFKRKHKG